MPFPIAFHKCSILNLINLDSAQIPALNLNGSYTGEISAGGIHVMGTRLATLTAAIFILCVRSVECLPLPYWLRCDSDGVHDMKKNRQTVAA